MEDDYNDDLEDEYDDESEDEYDDDSAEDHNTQDHGVLNFIELDAAKCLPQTQSVLFSLVPGEIRDQIFRYALSDYEDESDLYAEDTCYRRPGYFAPRRNDTALLRTCQKVYREAWFLPWTTREHTLFLTSAVRCPVKTTSAAEIQPVLNLIHAVHGKTEIDHIRIFPQLYRLEPGTALQSINDWHHFYPRRFTITLRHTDWWHWETDTALRINGRFMSYCQFPNSVQELVFELESIERRKEQINSIAKQMIDKWHFKRKDGVLLSAKDCSIDVMRWSGSSTWEGQRWVRDETRPDTLDYYVATIVFKPVRSTSSDAMQGTGGFLVRDLEVQGFTPITHPTPSLSVFDLEKANVPPGTPADDAIRMVTEFRSNRNSNPNHH